MLTKIFIIFSFISFSNCFSQSGWVQQNSGINSDLYSVKFISSNTGWSIGNGGKILKTTNGGTTWIQQSSGYQNNLRSLALTSEYTGFIVGDSGLTLKTTDGGISWTRLSLVKPYCFFSTVFFTNDSIGYTGGIDYNFNISNKIFNTTNSGDSWDSAEVLGSGSEFIKSIFFINSTLGWFTGGDEVITFDYVARTVNGGVNWSVQFGGYPPFNTVYFIDSINGWFTGRSLKLLVPTIFRTTNGGDNWITEFPGTGHLINSLYFTDKRNGWGAGDNSIIQATTNGGINWINQTTSQPGINYNSVYFTDSLTGWVVGDRGIILKTTTGGVITGFSNTVSEIPDKYFLSQNYPNPFNPVTNLEFGISDLGFVSLRVYNVLGNEIAVIVNEWKNAGTYNYQFSSVNYQLPSGIYFYSLYVDGELIDTKRMVLLK